MHHDNEVWMQHAALLMLNYAFLFAAKKEHVLIYRKDLDSYFDKSVLLGNFLAKS